MRVYTSVYTATYVSSVYSTTLESSLVLGSSVGYEYTHIRGLKTHGEIDKSIRSAEYLVKPKAIIPHFICMP